MRNFFENSGAAFGLTLFIIGVVAVGLALARCYEAFYLINALFWIYSVVGFFAMVLDDKQNNDINPSNIW